MEREKITFGKVTLPVILKSNLSFRVHKDIEGLDRSQKCILDHIWNAKSVVQKVEGLNALSFYFKQINDKLESFANTSSSDIHCSPMDTYLDYFSYREKAKEAVFSKPLQNEVQNGVQKLSDEEHGFQIARFSFFGKNILNFSQDLFPDLK